MAGALFDGKDSKALPVSFPAIDYSQVPINRLAALAAPGV